MTSGLAWDESNSSYDNPANDATQLFSQSDPIKFILMKTLTSTPGTQFHYNSGCTNVLSDLVRKTTGRLAMAINGGLVNFKLVEQNIPVSLPQAGVTNTCSCSPGKYDHYFYLWLFLHSQGHRFI